MNVVPIPPRIVPQSDLEMLLRLDNEIRQCQEIRNVIALDLIDADERGIPIEPGIYSATVVRSQHGGTIETRVIVE